MQKQIEALLFVAGDEGLAIQDLAKFLQTSPAQIKVQLEKLQAELEQYTSLTIYQKANQVYLVTQPQYEPLLQNYTNQTLNKRLSKASLEVLAIIAYKQPITRLEIDQIRGVNCSGSVQKLQAYQLIEDVGRIDGPGRARLLGTTDYFLQYFNLKSLADLPEIDLEQQAEEKTTVNLFTQFDELLDEED